MPPPPLPLLPRRPPAAPRAFGGRLTHAAPGRYSLVDKSYVDPAAFGFWVDTQNGFVALLPTAVFAAGLTWDPPEGSWALGACEAAGTSWPRAFGVLGIVVHYMEFMGTVIYFAQYAAPPRRLASQPVRSSGLQWIPVVNRKLLLLLIIRQGHPRDGNGEFFLF